MWLKKIIGKFTKPIMGLLKQGLTPGHLALSLAIGAVIGVFPLIGTTTTICILVAFVFRLNPVAIQVANYAVYPLQIVLFLPFIRLGEFLLNMEHVAFNPAKLVESASENFAMCMKNYGLSIGAACFAWFCLALPSIYGLWMILKFVLKKMNRPRFQDEEINTNVLQ